MTTSMSFVARLSLAAGLLSACMWVAQPARAQAATYELDPTHASVGFLVDHVGYAKVLGMFRTVRGSYRFDEATAALSNVRIEVDTASVFTNLAVRDKHLTGTDFFNSKEHPRMVFTANTARRTGERTFEVVGQLELLGRTQPLTLQATWNRSAESPVGGGLFSKPYVMGVSARGSFKRSTYGMTYGVANGWVGDEVSLLIEIEARRQP